MFRSVGDVVFANVMRDDTGAPLSAAHMAGAIGEVSAAKPFDSAGITTSPQCALCDRRPLQGLGNRRVRHAGARKLPNPSLRRASCFVTAERYGLAGASPKQLRRRTYLVLKGGRADLHALSGPAPAAAPRQANQLALSGRRSARESFNAPASASSTNLLHVSTCSLT